jgi:hypothetical protein
VNKQVSYFTSPISIMSKLYNCHICNFFWQKTPLIHYYLTKKEREKQRKHEIEKIKPSGARPHRNPTPSALSVCLRCRGRMKCTRDLPSASSPSQSATSIGWPKPWCLRCRDKDRLQQDHEGKQGHREDLYFKYNIAQVTLQNQENIVYRFLAWANQGIDDELLDYLLWSTLWASWFYWCMNDGWHDTIVCGFPSFQPFLRWCGDESPWHQKHFL